MDNLWTKEGPYTEAPRKTVLFTHSTPICQQLGQLGDIAGDVWLPAALAC
jgi:hypothetical protein